MSAMPARIADPLLLQLFDYWNSRRDGRPVPDRRDIDPVDMPRRLLPHLLLVELHGAVPRIRYRLVGTAICARYGADFTGTWLDEVSGAEYRHLLEDLYRRMRDTGRPIYTESEFRLDAETTAKTCRLYLPLQREGGITMALAGQTFPAYPFDERAFFGMIRTEQRGRLVHRDWLIDPDATAPAPAAETAALIAA